MRLNRTNREYMYQLDPIPNDDRESNRPPRRNSRAFVTDQYIENRKLSRFGQRPSFRCAAAPKPRGRISLTTACNQQERRQQRCSTLWRTRVDIAARPPDTSQINCERKAGSINAPPWIPSNHGRKNPREDKRVARRNIPAWCARLARRFVHLWLKSGNRLIRR